MDNSFSERYLNSLKNDTCPFCGKGLAYNRDYTESYCQDPKCQYKESIDFSKLIYPNKEYERKIHCEWIE